MEEDISLMLQVQRDDLSAFEKLYHKYKKPVATFFFRLGCNSQISEDYVQEVFLRIWRARKNYYPQAKFTTFMFQIAKNYWLNELAKHKRRPTTYHLYQISSGDEQLERESLVERPPETDVLNAELQQKIQEAIASLDEKYQLVFVLSEIEGLKYKEIADILAIPIGTVKSRMFIAEKKLREKLSRYLKIE